VVLLLTSFQSIDVLGIIPEQHSLVLQKPHKVVDWVGLVLPWVEFPGQGQEWFRIVGEEGDVKDGHRVWDPVLLQIVVQACARCPVCVCVCVCVCECVCVCAYVCVHANRSVGGLTTRSMQTNQYGGLVIKLQVYVYTNRY